MQEEIEPVERTAQFESGEKGELLPDVRGRIWCEPQGEAEQDEQP